MTPQTMMIVALVLFALTYVLMLTFSKYRHFIALGSGIVFVALILIFPNSFSNLEETPIKYVLASIDWNVILMLAGTMGLVALFIESKMPALLADVIMAKVPNVKWAAVALSLFAGIILAELFSKPSFVIFFSVSSRINPKFFVISVGVTHGILPFS